MQKHKLSYPEGMYFYTPVKGKRPGSSDTTITRYFHIVSVNNKWYLTVNKSSSTPNMNVSEACQLSNDINEWNHITLVYKFTGSNEKYADSIASYAYIDGRLAASSSSEGYKAATSCYLAEISRIHIPAKVVALNTPAYAFAIDNWTTNLYDAASDPKVENSMRDMFDANFDHMMR